MSIVAGRMAGRKRARTLRRQRSPPFSFVRLLSVGKLVNLFLLKEAKHEIFRLVGRHQHNKITRLSCSRFILSRHNDDESADAM